ncbi:MAG: DUF1553 domain-containing protein [Thermogutta sp.]|nr:DUF1553 domain-containing protein [Thermogutta sp.]
MSRILFHVLFLSCAAGLSAAALGGPGPGEILPPFESPGEFVPANRIDELTAAKWKELGIPPSPLCSDAVFIRRVYLDLTGTLPSADAVREFLADSTPQKRERLIESLFGTEAYADYWAMRWGDLLRIKSEFPINLWPNAVQCYGKWVRTAVLENMPYDRFARELLTSSGSNFRVPPVNFYRATQDRSPEGIAQTVALTFLGARAEKWPKDRLAGLAAFFTQIGYKPTGEWKEEIVCWDPTQALAKPESTAGRSLVAVLPDGKRIPLPAGRDPREVFAAWLTSPDNPYFAKVAVNRVWAWLLGRGIVHEPDDFREDNPPANPELLQYLADELVRSKYDLRHIYRLILHSRTYQLSAIPRSSDPRAEAQFAHYPVRRLEAEVLIDAICAITGTNEEYWSMIPEPYSIIPPGQRAVSLTDGSITSSFLELFGRPPRDSGLSTERNLRFTAGQRLHLLNSSHIYRKLTNGPGLAWLRESAWNEATIRRMYLTILSRPPTAEEMNALVAAGRGRAYRSRDLAVDAAWSLLNSTEFLYRH